MNRYAIIVFIAAERWSTVQHLARKFKCSRQTITRCLYSLAQEGLVCRKRTHAALADCWCCTSAGMLSAFRSSRAVSHPPSLQVYQHHLAVQAARIRAEQAGWCGWNVEPTFGDCTPDAVAVNPDGFTIAIEVERSVKSRSRYEHVWGRHLDAIKAGHFQGVLYLLSGSALRLEESAQLIIRLWRSAPGAGKQLESFRPHERGLFYFAVLDAWLEKS